LQTGNKHWNYKGGITTLYHQIRISDNNKQWRKHVFTRDSPTCQVCNDDKGGNLVAHHKVPFSYILGFYKIDTFEKAMGCRELWNINNGIVLCIKCHKQLHFENGYKLPKKELVNNTRGDCNGE